MKLHHFFFLFMLALSPLAPAEEASAESIASALESSAETMTKQSKQALKKLKKKKQSAAAQKEAKKKAAHAEKRAELLQMLAARLRAIEAGDAPVDEADDKGNTALMLAAALGEKDAVNWLLAKGASTTLRNSKEKNAAELCPDEELAQLIRAAGPPTSWDEMMALFQGNNESDAKEFLKLCAQAKDGADINADDGALFRKLIYACYSNEEDHRKGVLCAEFLISQGADVNAGKGGLSVLNSAALCAYSDMVVFLLARGADPTQAERILEFGRYLQLSPGWGNKYAEIIPLLVKHEGYRNHLKANPQELHDAVIESHLGMPPDPLTHALLDATKEILSPEKAVEFYDDFLLNGVKKSREDIVLNFTGKGGSAAGYDKALIAALDDCNPGIITLILQDGNSTQAGKDEALKLAREKGKTDYAEELIKYGAKE